MSEFTIGHKRDFWMVEYFRTLHFTALTFTPLVHFMVSAHAYPTFNISDNVQLNCWQGAKAGAVSGNSLLSTNLLSYITFVGLGEELEIMLVSV